MKLVVFDVDGTLCSVLEGSKLRPGASECVKRCLQKHHVGIWSAAGPEHVDEVLQRLLPDADDRKALKFVWTYEKCILRSRKHSDPRLSSGLQVEPVKPLRKLWRSALGRAHGWTKYNTTIVDDTPFTAHLNRRNLYRVSRFAAADDDAELDRIMRE